MAGSPFKGQGGNTATASKSSAAAADPTEDDVTTVGEDKPIARRASSPADDPYNAADPIGISALKPIAFMNQLVLIHPIETGRMVTANSGNEEDGKSPYTNVDLIPLTVPEEGGSPTKEQPVLRDDTVVVLNKDGDEEAFDVYAVGERLDELRFFNKPLVAECEKAIRKGNNWILGRITYGNKKPNQSRPIILAAADEADKEIYQAWREQAKKAAGK